MPVDANWANDDHTIIVLRMMFPWTWNEFYTQNKHVQEMFENSVHPVDLIIDTTVTKDGSRLPENAFSHFSQLRRNNHPRQRLTIMVSKSTLAVYVSRIIQRMNPNATGKFHLVKTMDEALALSDRANASS